MGLSRAIRRSLLNHFFNKASLSPATTFYVGVSLTLPTSTGQNVLEPTGGGYARQLTVPADWNTATDADPAAIVNNKIITFPQATADWYTGAEIPYVVLYSAVTGGTFYGFGEFSRPKPVYIEDILTVNPGKLAITLS